MVELTFVGGPTAVLDYAGLRWLTDPSLSRPGEYAGGLVKTTGPAIEPDAAASDRRRAASRTSITVTTSIRPAANFCLGPGAC